MDTHHAAIVELARLTLNFIHTNSIQQNPIPVTIGLASGEEAEKMGYELG